jgi:hypothetical protein
VHSEVADVVIVLLTQHHSFVDSKIMSLSSLTHRYSIFLLYTHSHVFGTSSSVSNNLAFFDEQTIVYPAGSQMVFYEIDQKVQRFLSIDEEGIMSTMSLHPSGKSLAVAIKFQLKEEEVLSEEKAAYIVVYDLSSTKKKKVYSIREPLISVKFKLY